MWVYQRVDEFREMPICHLNKSGIVISDLLKMIVAYRFIFFPKRFIHHLGNPLGRCLQTLEVPGSTNPSGWWSISDFQTWRWWSQSMKLLVYYRMYWNYQLAAASQKTFTKLDPPSRHSATLEWWGIHYWTDPLTSKCQSCNLKQTDPQESFAQDLRIDEDKQLFHPQCPLPQCHTQVPFHFSLKPAQFPTQPINPSGEIRLWTFGGRNSGSGGGSLLGRARDLVDL